LHLLLIICVITITFIIKVFLSRLHLLLIICIIIIIIIIIIRVLLSRLHLLLIIYTMAEESNIFYCDSGFHTCALSFQAKAGTLPFISISFQSIAHTIFVLFQTI
jgi:hypothetical protein